MQPSARRPPFASVQPRAKSIQAMTLAGGHARPFTSGGGLPVRQAGSARRQRGWKVQPGGRSAGLGGSLGVAGGDGAGVETRHRRQQRLRVGMARRAEDLLGAALLDDAAEVHHRDLGADLAHDRRLWLMNR